MLLVFVMGVVSHRGRTFDFFSEKKHRKRNQLLRAPNSVSRRSSMRVNEKGKGWSLVAMKKKARTAMGRGEDAC